MFGDVEVQDSATAVSDYERQYSTRKVAVGTVKKSMAAIALTMVLEKGEPALASVARRGPLRQVAGDGGLGDFRIPISRARPGSGERPKSDSRPPLIG